MLLTTVQIGFRCPSVKRHILYRLTPSGFLSRLKVITVYDPKGFWDFLTLRSTARKRLALRFKCPKCNEMHEVPLLHEV